MRLLICLSLITVFSNTSSSRIEVPNKKLQKDFGCQRHICKALLEQSDTRKRTCQETSSAETFECLIWKHVCSINASTILTGGIMTEKNKVSANLTARAYCLWLFNAIRPHSFHTQNSKQNGVYDFSSNLIPVKDRSLHMLLHHRIKRGLFRRQASNGTITRLIQTEKPQPTQKLDPETSQKFQAVFILSIIGITFFLVGVFSICCYFCFKYYKYHNPYFNNYGTSWGFSDVLPRDIQILPADPAYVTTRPHTPMTIRRDPLTSMSYGQTSINPSIFPTTSMMAPTHIVHNTYPPAWGQSHTIYPPQSTSTPGSAPTPTDPANTTGVSPHTVMFRTNGAVVMVMPDTANTCNPQQHVIP